MKQRQMFFVVFSLLASSVSARNQWQTATTVNGKTKPISVGLETPLLELSVSESGVSSRASASVSGGTRDFDIVISYYGKPDGDNDGNHQATNPIQWSTQDKIEKIIQSFADGIYESTEGAHRLPEKN